MTSTPSRSWGRVPRSASGCAIAICGGSTDEVLESAGVDVADP